MNNEMRHSFFGFDSELYPREKKVERGEVIFGMTRMWYDGDTTHVTMINQTDAKVPLGKSTTLAALSMKDWVQAFIKEVKKLQESFAMS
jgi:hypothetical protein